MCATSWAATDRKSLEPDNPLVVWPKCQGLDGLVSKEMAPPHGANSGPAADCPRVATRSRHGVEPRAW
jgi:hypothetical protein